jgi:hypothetical protein
LQPCRVSRKVLPIEALYSAFYRRMGGRGCVDSAPHLLAPDRFAEEGAPGPRKAIEARGYGDLASAWRSGLMSETAGAVQPHRPSDLGNPKAGRAPEHVRILRHETHKSFQLALLPPKRGLSTGQSPGTASYVLEHLDIYIAGR